jgi:CheY-like chemotaxis protein
MEATAGIEPADKGFADLCLTTWLRRQLRRDASVVNDIPSVKYSPILRYWGRSSMSEQYRVLVVDDDEAIRKLISAILRRRNFIVDTAANGEEALKKLGEHHYTIMLLDLMMPRVDGYTVIDRVREQKIATEIVVVTAAGASQVKAIDRSIVRVIISKPFDVTQLVEVVSSVCATSKA